MVCYRRGVTGVRKPPCIPCNQFNNKCNTCSCVILNKKWLPHKDFCYRCMRLAFVRVNMKRQVAWFLQLLRLAACNTACTTACGDAPKEASSKCTIKWSPCFKFRCILFCIKIFVADHFSDLRSNEYTPSFNFASLKPGKTVMRCLKPSPFLSIANTKFFISPKFNM